MFRTYFAQNKMHISLKCLLQNGIPGTAAARYLKPCKTASSVTV